MSWCRDCGAEIDWIETEEGRRVAVNPVPVYIEEGAGTARFIEDSGVMLTGRRSERRTDTIAFIPHRLTCRRQAARWN